MTVEETCRETGVSRAGFYRHWQRCGPSAEETELRDRLQQLALKQRTYGYRRIAVLLRREGRLVKVDRTEALRDLAHHQVELRFADGEVVLVVRGLIMFTAYTSYYLGLAALPLADSDHGGTSPQRWASTKRPSSRCTTTASGWVGATL